MGCPTDTVLVESTKNTRKTQRRATMEPLNTPALMPTKDFVSLPVHKQRNEMFWAHGWSLDWNIICGNLVNRNDVLQITMCSKLQVQCIAFSPHLSSWFLAITPKSTWTSTSTQGVCYLVLYMTLSHIKTLSLKMSSGKSEPHFSQSAAQLNGIGWSTKPRLLPWLP